MTLQSTLAAFPYISMDWASNLELLGRNLSKPFPGQAAQVLGCLQLHIGEGETVHGLRVLGSISKDWRGLYIGCTPSSRKVKFIFPLTDPRAI